MYLNIKNSNMAYIKQISKYSKIKCTAYCQRISILKNEI